MLHHPLDLQQVVDPQYIVHIVKQDHLAFIRRRLRQTDQKLLEIPQFPDQPVRFQWKPQFTQQICRLNIHRPSGRQDSLSFVPDNIDVLSHCIPFDQNFFRIGIENLMGLDDLQHLFSGYRFLFPEKLSLIFFYFSDQNFL